VFSRRSALRFVTIAASALCFLVAGVGLGQSNAVAKQTDCLDYGYGCTPGYNGANAAGTWAWTHYGGRFAQTPNGYHNCTLYAAWRLEQNGMQDPGNWGNAADWASHNGGGNNTPAVGAIAWWGKEVAGGLGHVAYVDQVSGSQVHVVADNFSYTRGYTDFGWIPASSVDKFLHPHDLLAGSAGSTGSLAANGGFENGWGPWAAFPGTHTNWVDYRSGQVAGESARSGLHYGATNTSSSGGGISEDVPVSVTPGQLICASAWVRTQYPSSGGSGSFVLWLLGGSYNENGVANFSNLGNAGNWRQVQTCVAASTPHSVLRIQLYPHPNGPTVDIDDIDVH
jgi:surface antigen